MRTKGLLGSGLILLATIVGLMQLPVHAATVDRSRDYDKYAIVYGGTMSVDEVRKTYNSDDHAAVFSAFGIDQGELNGDIRKGVVYQDGRVEVDGDVVASNASMAARELGGATISGSTTAKKVSVSKMGSAQEALVKFDDSGRFVWAIMTPCGNPVNATPTPKPTSQPQPQPTTTTSNPCPIPGKSQLQADSPECTQENATIEITKTVNNAKTSTVTADETFTYQVRIVNPGSTALQDVRITDTAPDGVTFISATKGDVTAAGWRYTIPTLSRGTSMLFLVTAKITGTLDGSVTNTACVDAPGVPNVCDDATIEPLTTVCDIDSGEVTTVSQSQAADSQYTTDISQCDEVRVCDTDSGDVISVPRAEQADYGSETADACHVKDVNTDEDEVVPEELPTTGPLDAISGITGVGALTISGYYYIISKRSI